MRQDGWPRGYAAVAVDSILSEPNMGGVIRAAQIFSAALVVFGTRQYKKQPTDVMKGYRHIPLLQVEDVLSTIPYDCIPVGVEITDHAVSLIEYQHPQRAYYIFGPENGTLGNRILSRCKHIVKIPSERCLNLAACVNVVLYDRLSKQIREQLPAE